MVRKKSKRAVLKRKPTAKLETRFDCPVCSHEQVVQCKISKAGGMGYALCSACEANFKCPVSALDRATDVYHTWVDRILASNEKKS